MELANLGICLLIIE